VSPFTQLTDLSLPINPANNSRTLLPPASLNPSSRKFPLALLSMVLTAWAPPLHRLPLQQRLLLSSRPEEAPRGRAQAIGPHSSLSTMEMTESPMRRKRRP